MENFQGQSQGPSFNQSKLPLILSIIAIAALVVYAGFFFYMDSYNVTMTKQLIADESQSISDQISTLHTRIEALEKGDVVENGDAGLEPQAAVIDDSGLAVNIAVSKNVLSTCSANEYCKKGLCVPEKTPNVFGCAIIMTCSGDTVCRNGACVKKDVAPDQYGCHPAMTCSGNTVCRSGLCVNKAEAINEYGCHPSMKCDAGEVCRSGLCVAISAACK